MMPKTKGFLRKITKAYYAMTSKIKELLRRRRELYYAYVYPLFQKRRVECPFCGWWGREFFPFGVIPRKNAECPRCGSLERHRLYYLYLKNIIPKNKSLKLLHFAPAKSMSMFFKSYSNLDYLSVDIDQDKAMKKEDIVNLSFPDNSFDIILCSHVLEHVEDDQKAMGELYRVLKPSGFALLGVPVKSISKTFEDFSVVDPEEREMVFGQNDHVRIYGKDFKTRLEHSGFNVKVVKFLDSLSEDTCNKYALKTQDIYFRHDNYFCTK